MPVFLAVSFLYSNPKEAVKGVIAKIVVLPVLFTSLASRMRVGNHSWAISVM
jgi:hypothetical protein